MSCLSESFVTVLDAMYSNIPNQVFSQGGTTINAIAIWNGTNTGILKNSLVTISPSGFIYCEDGTASEPSYSFTSDVTTGMFKSGLSQVSLVGGGATALVADANKNVSLAGSVPSNYGNITSGSGCVYFNSVTIEPAGIPNGGTGGLLYVKGNSLNFVNATGAITSLGGGGGAGTGNVTGPSPAVSNSICLFNGSAGTLIKSSSVIVDDAGALFSTNGSAAAPSYSFTADTTTGMFLSSSEQLDLTAGGTTSFVANANCNIAVSGGAPTNYASGKGCMFINNVQTAPSGSLASGGILYVNGASLCFLNSAGTLFQITDMMTLTTTQTVSGSKTFTSGISANAIASTGALSVTGQASVGSLSSGAVTCTSLSSGVGGISTSGGIVGATLLVGSLTATNSLNTGALTATSVNAGSGVISTTGSVNAGVLTVSGSTTLGSLFVSGSTTLGSTVVGSLTTGAVSAGSISCTSLSSGVGGLSTSGGIAGATLLLSGSLTATGGTVSAGALNATSINSGGTISGGTLSSGSLIVTSLTTLASLTISGLTTLGSTVVGTLTTGAVSSSSVNCSSLSCGIGGISSTGAVVATSIGAGSGSITTTGTVNAGTLNVGGSSTLASLTCTSISSGSLNATSVNAGSGTLSSGSLIVSSSSTLASLTVAGLTTLASAVVGSLTTGAVVATSISAGSGSITTTGTVNAGTLIVGGASTLGALTCTSISSGSLSFSGVKAANGTVSLPAYAFNSDSSSGMYLASTGNVGISAAGTVCMVASTGGNVSFGAPPATYNSGVGVVYINTAATNPTTNALPTSGGYLYAANGTGALMYNVNPVLQGPSSVTAGTLSYWTGAGALDQATGITVSSGSLSVSGSVTAAALNVSGQATCGSLTSSTVTVGSLTAPSGNIVFNSPISGVSADSITQGTTNLFLTPNTPGQVISGTKEFTGVITCDSGISVGTTTTNTSVIGFYGTAGGVPAITNTTGMLTTNVASTKTIVLVSGYNKLTIGNALGVVFTSAALTIQNGNSATTGGIVLKGSSADSSIFTTQGGNTLNISAGTASGIQLCQNTVSKWAIDTTGNTVYCPQNQNFSTTTTDKIITFSNSGGNSTITVTNSNGNMTTNIPTGAINTFNVNAQTIATISGTGLATTQGLSVAGATTLLGALLVAGATTLTTTTLSGPLTLTGSTNPGLSVAGATTLLGALLVAGTTTLATATLSGSLLVAGATTLTTTTLSGPLTLTGSANPGLSVAGATTLLGALLVSGATTLSGSLLVAGATTLTTTTLSGPLTLTGSTNPGLSVAGATTLLGALLVAGATTLTTTTLSGSLLVAGATTLTTTTLSGPLTLTGSTNPGLSVAGATTLLGSLVVAGTTTLSSLTASSANVNSITYPSASTASITLAANNNVSLIGPITGGTYNSGKGVVFIQSCNTVPSAAATGGGYLYVNSGSLMYYGATGLINLSSPTAGVTGPATVTTNGIACWSSVGVLEDVGGPIVKPGSYIFGITLVSQVIETSVVYFSNPVGTGAYTGNISSSNNGIAFSAYNAVGLTNPDLLICPDNNISFGSYCINGNAFSAGKGVLYIGPCITPPTSGLAPNGGVGGILYISGSSLYFLNNAGTIYNVVGAPASVTANAVACWTSAGVLQNSSVTISGNTISGISSISYPAASVPSISLDGNNNVAMIKAGTYNSGAGVLYIGPVTTAPTAAAITAGGGILYVSGALLLYMDNAGLALPIARGPATVTASGIACWSAEGVLTSSDVIKTYISGAGWALQTNILNIANTNGTILGGLTPGNQAASTNFYLTDTTGPCVVLQGNQNVSFGGIANSLTGFGATTAGKGVIFIEPCTTVPVGIPNLGVGGILYVSGSNLSFLNSAGVARNLNNGANIIMTTFASTDITQGSGVSFASAPITPAFTTSKIKLTLSTFISSTSTTNTTALSFLKNGVATYQIESFVSGINIFSNNWNANGGACYVDSPGTISSVTYACYVYVNGGGGGKVTASAGNFICEEIYM